MQTFLCIQRGKAGVNYGHRLPRRSNSYNLNHVPGSDTSSLSGAAEDVDALPLNRLEAR